MAPFAISPRPVYPKFSSVSGMGSALPGCRQHKWTFRIPTLSSLHTGDPTWPISSPGCSKLW